MTCALLSAVHAAVAPGQPANQPVPRRIAASAVIYPQAAARTGLQGPVVGRLSIGRSGRVMRVDLLSGDSRLAGAARTAMTTWRFSPGPATVLAAVNVAPVDPAVAPNVLPAPVVAQTRNSAGVTGTPGRATLMLNVSASGRVIDAIGVSGSEDVLVEALDSALRWTTEPLVSRGTTEAFQCRAEWVNGGNAFMSPPRDTLATSDPIFSEEMRAGATPTPVILEVLIQADGIVETVKVLRSNPSLDDEAVRAVRGWRFAPLFLNGSAIRTITVLTIRSP